MAKITQADLRRIGIVNSFEFYGEQPYISHRDTVSRDVTPSAWYAVKRGEDLNDGHGAGYEHDARWFVHTGGGTGPLGKAALAKAQAWASERFGIDSWAKDPFGGYGPADYIAEHLAFLQPLVDALPPAPLPVYRWTGFIGGIGQADFLVAAKTKTAVSREHQVSTRELQETGNKTDCELARSTPGVVYAKPMRAVFSDPWQLLDELRQQAQS